MEYVNPTLLQYQATECQVGLVGKVVCVNASVNATFLAVRPDHCDHLKTDLTIKEDLLSDGNL